MTNISRIQGFHNRNDYNPPVLEKGAFEGILSIDEDRSLELSRQLVQMGISAGLSSGANLWGAIELAREIKRGQIVTVFPDGMEKYLSTGLII